MMNRTTIVLATMMLPLAAMAASGAATPDPTREALKAYMVSLQGPDYNPLATMTVAWGYYPDLQAQTMTADEHLNLYVDHLVATGQEFCAGATPSSEDVPTDMRGTICVQEYGYIDEHWDTTINTGATCPSIALAGDELDALGDPASSVTEDEDHVGTMTSTVSKHGKYTPRYGGPRYAPQSNVVHYDPTTQQATSYSYGGSNVAHPGHTMKWYYIDWAWLDGQVPGDALFSGNEYLWVSCAQDATNQNLLVSYAIVNPRVWRTD
jgi:hypothetical protein